MDLLLKPLSSLGKNPLCSSKEGDIFGEKDECFERGLDYEAKKGGPGSRGQPSPVAMAEVLLPLALS